MTFDALLNQLDQVGNEIKKSKASPGTKSNMLQRRLEDFYAAIRWEGWGADERKQLAEAARAWDVKFQPDKPS